MNPKTNEIEVQNLDHLGIVAGIIDEIGLVEKVNELMGTQEQEILSLGQILKAMILNGLGFVSAPLYLFSQFFDGKAIEHLLGEGIEARHLNDDRLGRALDKFYAYGVTKLFTTIALSAANKFGVERVFQHLDSSSISVEGEYARQESVETKAQEEFEQPKPINITYGYSKDRRPDLKQFLVDTICSSDGDIPLFFRVADGNEADGVGFGKVIHEYRQEWHFDGIIVADAALYNADNLQQMKGLRWISRVPTTINHAQEMLKQVTPIEGWKDLPEGYKIIEFSTTYAEVVQRWIVVESDKRKEADLKQLNRRIEKEGESKRRQLATLSKEKFGCEKDALKAVEKFKKTLKYHELSQVSVMAKPYHEKRGFLKADIETQSLDYHIEATLLQNKEVIKEEQLIAGRFILATNILESDEITGVKILEEYKNQQSSERGFRFIKDPMFFTASVFLKSPQRIMALAMVMALCLLIYTLAQRKLRKALSEAQEEIPNQLGKLTSTPTMRWVFQCFQAIHLVTISGRKQISNLTSRRCQILRLLGSFCCQYYLLE